MVLLLQAYDAFVERMLMSLVLVRDQVEQSRFAIKPYALRSDNGDVSAADTLVDAAEAIGADAGAKKLGKVSQQERVYTCAWHGCYVWHAVGHVPHCHMASTRMLHLPC